MTGILLGKLLYKSFSAMGLHVFNEMFLQFSNSSIFKILRLFGLSVLTLIHQNIKLISQTYVSVYFM